MLVVAVLTALMCFAALSGYAKAEMDVAFDVDVCLHSEAVELCMCEVFEEQSVAWCDENLETVLRRRDN